MVAIAIALSDSPIRGVQEPEPHPILDGSPCCATHAFIAATKPKVLFYNCNADIRPFSADGEDGQKKRKINHEPMEGHQETGVENSKD